MKNEKIEFTDRRGRSLYVGDIVQYRLGKFAKKGGEPSLYKVTRSKRRGVVLASLQYPDWPGMILRKTDIQFITVTESDHLSE